jgi:hypothetical protein
MSSESVCHVARSWVGVGSFHKRLFIIFMICTASVRNISDLPSYICTLSVLLCINIPGLLLRYSATLKHSSLSMNMYLGHEVELHCFKISAPIRLV